MLFSRKQVYPWPLKGVFYHAGLSKTNKGNLFRCTRVFPNTSERIGGRGVSPKSGLAGSWLPKITKKIQGTGESALAFGVPKDEIPIEVVIDNLRFKLPQRPFGFRIYTDCFGFLPEKAEEVVPGLVKILTAPRLGTEPDTLVTEADAIDALGKIGPSAKAAVPALEAYARGQELGFGLATRAKEAIRKITGNPLGPGNRRSGGPPKRGGGRIGGLK